MFVCIAPSAGHEENSQDLLSLATANVGVLQGYEQRRYPTSVQLIRTLLVVPLCPHE